MKKKYPQQQVTYDEEEAIKTLKEQISRQYDTIQTLKRAKKRRRRKWTNETTVLEMHSRAKKPGIGEIQVCAGL
ncbi:MAG: hypothetical protein J0651_04960 [Actinobacteria bacterium]|nr:hypothetical protein [Actinomycetota bacterium]